MFNDFQLPLTPPRASSFAYEYDLLFWYISLVVLLGGGLTIATMIYFCFRYAAKSEPAQTPRLLGSTSIEVTWTLIPFLFFASFFVWGVRIYSNKISAPIDVPEYYVVGKQWMWKIQHPTGQREINELHLPLNRTVRITGTSEDVIHDFAIPAFRSKFDVVPGRYVTTWYHPTKVGKYHIFCDQYCGMGHSQMVGTVIVMNPSDYDAWLQGLHVSEEGKNPVDGSASWEGKKLFLKLQCNACHNADGVGRAPQLAGIYMQRRPLQGGRDVLADDAYLRESIRDPMAKIVDGWKPIMPAYARSQVSEEELLNLVAYIRSLRNANDLPKRYDRYPAPVGAPGAPTDEGGLTRE